MSSLHDRRCESACDAENASHAAVTPEADRDRAPNTVSTPSYSPHFHLNCVTTFRGTGLRLLTDVCASKTAPDFPAVAHRQTEKPESAADALKSIRERRTAVLNEMFGIWKDRDDIPYGLEFQKAMRDEWR